LSVAWSFTPVCGLHRSSALSALGLESENDFVRDIKIEVIIPDRLARKAVNAVFDYVCSEKEGQPVRPITVLDIDTTVPIGSDS
jgi:hypothetical protein